MIILLVIQKSLILLYEKESYNLSGYIKEWDLGDTAEIIPKSNGGDITQYKCDYHNTNIGTGLRTLSLGGNANRGDPAGLGNFFSGVGMGRSFAHVGFRLALVPQ